MGGEGQKVQAFAVNDRSLNHFFACAKLKI